MTCNNIYVRVVYPPNGPRHQCHATVTVTVFHIFQITMLNLVNMPSFTTICSRFMKLWAPNLPGFTKKCISPGCNNSPQQTYLCKNWKVCGSILLLNKYELFCNLQIFMKCFCFICHEKSRGEACLFFIMKNWEKCGVCKKVDLE